VRINIYVSLVGGRLVDCILFFGWVAGDLCGFLAKRDSQISLK
jgi:hypothetical protein